MKLSAIVCISLFFALVACSPQPVESLQSSDSADHDRCFHQYKGNPVGMHEDEICLNLQSRGWDTPVLLYLLGRSYQLDGQNEKAAEYFSQVVEDGQDYCERLKEYGEEGQDSCEKAAEQLKILEGSQDEK